MLSLTRSVAGKRQNYLVYRLSQVPGQRLPDRRAGGEGASSMSSTWSLRRSSGIPALRCGGAPGKVVKVGWDLKQNKAV